MLHQGSSHSSPSDLHFVVSLHYLTLTLPDIYGSSIKIRIHVLKKSHHTFTFGVPKEYESVCLTGALCRSIPPVCQPSQTPLHLFHGYNLTTPSVVLPSCQKTFHQLFSDAFSSNYLSPSISLYNHSTCKLSKPS